MFGIGIVDWSTNRVTLTRNIYRVEVRVGNGRSDARHLHGLVFAILFVIAGVASGATSGATWTQINNGLPFFGAGASALVFDRSSPATLYSWSDRGPVFKSVDGA